MRIFQVINVRWFNATAWYAITLSKLLADAGHEVTVITQADTQSEKVAQDLGLDTVAVNLNTVNPVQFAKAARQTIRLLKSRKPHIVNCHRGEGFFLWGFLKLAGFPFKLVRTRGDQRLPKCDAINRWLHASIADAVVVTNRRMADYFLQKMLTPANNVWLIHGGVDSNKYAYDPTGRERVRKEFGYNDDDIVIGLLGRFDRVKGHKETIEAVARLRANGMANVRLFLIGFDTAMTSREIENLLTAYDLHDITKISGKRSDVGACVSAVDYGVVASLWSEAIARSALELMAAGRPLVSTDVGVMPDLVLPELLVPPGDSEALANALRRIISSPKLLAETLESQKRTMSQLTLEEFLKRSLTLYQGLN